MKKPFFTTRELCLTAVCTTLTIIFAQIIVPLPFTPVPISFGLVAVYLSGIFLPPKCAIASQLVYLFLGAVGLPVFGGFQGGLGRLFGPTGGALFAYPFMAALISISFDKAKIGFLSSKDPMAFPKSLIVGFTSVFAALAIVYLSATWWLSFIMNISIAETLMLTVAPFVILDIVKVLFTVLVFVPVRKQLFQAGIIPLPTKAKQHE